MGKEGDRLLTPAEVADVFRVDPKTVTRWATGKGPRGKRLPSIRTPGGHRRFWESDINARLEDETDDDQS